MTKDDGGPAFPAQFFDERAVGMTLRDYFAAKIMQESISHPDADDTEPIEHAQWSYMMADAMLEARKE